MKIDILTLFPNMFDGFKTESIIKRSIDKEIVEINIIDIRDFTPYKNKQVDDYAFGGGPGMIMMCEPVFNAVESVKDEDAFVIILSPRGKTYNQKIAVDLSKKKHLIIICGHYEGFDERIKLLADEIISIGDFVLTGGELPAMMITDSIVRLISGVINKESLESESFNDNLLDYPTYTKPEEYRGMKVPSILLSGNHQKIDEYRKSEKIRVTREKRNDLMGD